MIKKNKVNTPTILQMEAVECGAAALAMVLAYFGRYVPLEELRLDCGISRNGSKANNIARAAKKHNLNVKAYSKEPEELKKLKVPMIIFWKFYHFIVVEGFSKNFVHINDPASGKRKVSYDEFDNSFTGIVLTFEPNEKFEKAGNQNTTFKALNSRLKPFYPAVLFLLLTGVALIVPNLAIPVLSKIYIDEVWIKQTNDWAIPLLCGLLLTGILRGLYTWMQERYLFKLETGLAVTSSAKFLKHLLKLPMEFYTQRSPN
jgi:ABC-type bacteriocin/lantibiotic exporter with double-glycine peptidase domain